MLIFEGVDFWNWNWRFYVELVVTVERSSMNLDFNDENLINEGGPNKSDGVGKF